MRIMIMLMAICLGATSAVAADFNCPRVKIVVPYGAGGSADVASRIVADRLSKALKTTVYVENKPGATGNIGTQVVADSAPDGCTLLINGTVIATFADSFPHLKYDPFKSLTPVGGVGSTPSIILSAPQLKANDIKTLVALSKSKPDGLTFAIAGIGLQQHLATEEIAQRTGAKFVTVPYKGGGPALTDLMSARVDFGTLLGGTTKVYVKAGKLKALAVLQDKRSALLPDVPSAAEQGFPGLLGAVQFLLFAPGGTPKPIVDKISGALREVISQPDLKEHFLKVGLEPTPMSPEELTQAMLQMRKAYAPIIKSLHIKLN
jgi:tripartite-type tricarboxylate transporter receptor subunit TctC